MNSQTSQPIEGASQRESGDRVPSHERDKEEMGRMIREVRNLLGLVSNLKEDKNSFCAHAQNIIAAVHDCMKGDTPNTERAEGLLRGFRNVFANLFHLASQNYEASHIYSETLRTIEQNEAYGKALSPIIQHLKVF